MPQEEDAHFSVLICATCAYLTTLPHSPLAEHKRVCLPLSGKQGCSSIESNS